METINDRMEMLVNERFNGNKAAFAKAIAVEPTTMSSYLGTKRRSKPSVDMVTKIVVSLGVDARWLLTGEERGKTVPDNTPASNAAHHAEDVAVLKERIRSLEALLTEKERLIKVLLESRA